MTSLELIATTIPILEGIFGEGQVSVCTHPLLKYRVEEALPHREIVVDKTVPYSLEGHFGILTLLISSATGPDPFGYLNYVIAGDGFDPQNPCFYNAPEEENAE